jgi:ABC-type Mn2+/Zn2+ transport system ATPase subunit
MPMSVELSGVRFAYGASPVLDGADMALRAGEFVVLAGHNGSGKSTLLKLCVGLLRAQAGTVRVLGGRPDDATVRRRIGYAPQGLRVVTSIPVSVDEVVGAGLTPAVGVWRRDRVRERARVDAALDAVGMQNLAHECLFELSGGQQQRAILARALVADPPLLLLDEPTTGIDQSLRPRLVSELRARADAGATVLAVSHDPDDFHAVLDRILVIADGGIRQLTHEQFHAHFEVT